MYNKNNNAKWQTKPRQLRFVHLVVVVVIQFVCVVYKCSLQHFFHIYISQNCVVLLWLYNVQFSEEKSTIILYYMLLLLYYYYNKNCVLYTHINKPKLSY